MVFSLSEIVRSLIPGSLYARWGDIQEYNTEISDKGGMPTFGYYLLGYDLFYGIMALSCLPTNPYLIYSPFRFLMYGLTISCLGTRISQHNTLDKLELYLENDENPSWKVMQDIIRTR